MVFVFSVIPMAMFAVPPILAALGWILFDLIGPAFGWWLMLWFGHG